MRSKMAQIPSGTLLLAIILVNPGISAGSRIQQLQWIPETANLVAFFDYTNVSNMDLLARFQAEVLFATRVGEGLQDLIALTGLNAQRDISLVLVASVPLEDRENGVIGIIHGKFDKNLLPSSLIAAGAVESRYHKHDIYVASAKRELAVAMLDAANIVFGDVSLVKRSIDLHRGAAKGSVTRNPKVIEDLQESANAAHGWGVIDRTWLGFKLDANKQSISDIRGWSLGRSLAAIQSVTFLAQISSDLDFVMRTNVSEEEDAKLLADELRGFLIPVKRGARGGSAELPHALDRAQVRRKGTTIELSMTVAPEAMARINKNEVSRRLFGWRLGAEERERREKVAKVFELLALTDGTHVADVGAGEGFFTVRLARALGSKGRVYAVDISKEIVTELRQRVAEAPYEQVEIILGEADNPKLPAGTLDAVLIVNSYHEMPQYQKMLEHIRRALKPGGRLLLIEPFSPSRRNEPRETQERDHLLAPELVEEELLEAGLEIVLRNDAFVESQKNKTADWLILARRPN